MRTLKQKPTCYMCAAPPVGKEHAPPRAMFPEASVFRKNLITVPSCKWHNGDKSDDDALLRWYLSSTQGNNELASEVMRAVFARLESQPALIPTYMDGLTARRLEPGWTGLTYQIDLRRFESSIKAMVRALYYYESKFSQKLLEELEIVWTVMKGARNLSEPEYYDLVRLWAAALPPINRGANPRVFRYRFDFPDPTGGLCRLQFYEGQVIYVL